MNKAIKTVLIVALAVSAAHGLRAQTLTGMDVGTPTNPGSTAFAGGQYTIVGGGSDIWGNSDNFHYAYMSVTGDFDYILKVESLTGNAGDGGWSKVELMARREDPASPGGGPTGGDEHISNMTTRPSSDTPTGGSAGVNYRGPQWRPVRDGASTWTTPNPGYPPNMPNNWMRLERVGRVFWMYTSNDGTTWNQYNPFDPQGWDTAGSWPPGADNSPNSAFLEAWGSTCFLGIAVTAHSDPDTTTAVVSNFKAWTPVPIAITTQPPATIAVSANSTLSIPVVATGDPVHYEWRKDGVPLTTNQMGATYSKPLCQVSDSGTYTVRCYGAKQIEKISTPCVVTITVDTTPPTMTKAIGSPSFTEATITFSEPVKAPTATTPGNYTIAGLAVTGASLSADEFKVTLTTARQAEGTPYTITVNNVLDSAGNPITAGSTIQFKSFSFLPGSVMMELWPDEAGVSTDLASFIASRIGYDAAPTTPIPAGSWSVQPGFETPSWENGSNYGGRLHGWFMPPANGNYIFYTSSDDQSNLMLSTDDTPANKKKITFEPSWNGQRDWLGVARRDAAAPETRSDTWMATEWAGGNVITLQAGRKYFMEGVWKEGGGGDGLAVTYRLDTEDEATVIVNGQASRITGALIGAYADTSTLPPTITTHPVDSLTLDPGATATLTVVANNPAAGDLSYQWTLNGRNIPGATSASYVIANAGPLDIGQYRVIVSNANGSVTSGDGNPNPTVVLVKGTGVYAIEAEDFDYGSGQTKPEASVMPYVGGAYNTLGAVFDVDYHNTDILDSTACRTLPDGQNADTSSETGGQWTMTRAGEWTMTANYKIGWVGSGDWGNYTRTFPTPAKTYYVFAAQAYDGVSASQLNSTLGFVTAGVGTTTQTVENVGTFDAQGSGDWSRNNLVAMTDGAGGPVKTVEIGGTKTIRWQYNSGDADYLLFYPATAGPTISAAKNPQGQPVLTFTGVLRAATTVTGSYDVVAGATSPYTVTGGTDPMKFYRAASQ